MSKLLPLTALAVALSGGVALADHGRGGGNRGAVEHRAAPAAHVAVREHGGYGGGRAVVREHAGGYGYGGRAVVASRGGYYGGRTVVRGAPYYRGVARGPIYGSRPVIRGRYFNYYRRPSLIVENYGPRAGYFWVAGHWTWDGGEWIWQPGYYQPNAGYAEPSYDPGYGY